MKEKHPFMGNPRFELLGIRTNESGPLVVTEYYFKGWIPMTQFTNGLRPEYVRGWSGQETVVREEGIRPVTVVSVQEYREDNA